MKKIEISVVIPVYNEKESLEELVRRLNFSLKPTGQEYELIFVDDGSTDGSGAELVKLKSQTKTSFTVIRFRKNQGKSAVLATGFKYAKGEKIVMIDADLQDSPEEIVKLLQKLDEGYDLVVGWRKERKDPANKIRLSRFFNTVVAKVGNLNLHDMNCGLKAMRKSVTDEIELYGELHRFLPILASSRGFKVTEIPVVHSERKYGISKYGKSRIVQATFDLCTTYFLIGFKNKPMQVFGRTGAVCTAIGILILFYLSYLHFQGEKIGNRPLLFLGILFVLFGLQLFSTGLLAELIAHGQARKESYPISEVLE